MAVFVFLLTLSGFLLQLAGIIVAARGYAITWRDFGPPGESLTSHWTAPLSKGWLRVARAFDRVLGRRRDAVATAGAAHLSLTGMKANVRATFQFPRLPYRMAARDAIPQLDERTRRLVEIISNEAQALHERVDQLEADAKKLAGKQAADVASLNQRDQHVATGGIRTQADGLLLIGVGLGLQALAFALQGL